MIVDREGQIRRWRKASRKWSNCRKENQSCNNNYWPSVSSEKHFGLFEHQNVISSGAKCHGE